METHSTGGGGEQRPERGPRTGGGGPGAGRGGGGGGGGRGGGGRGRGGPGGGRGGPGGGRGGPGGGAGRGRGGGPGGERGGGRGGAPETDASATDWEHDPTRDYRTARRRTSSNEASGARRGSHRRRRGARDHGMRGDLGYSHQEPRLDESPQHGSRGDGWSSTTHHRGTGRP